MKKVFVTGANGLLGTNLINLLLENGYYVKGLLRDVSKFKGLNHPNLKLITGDLFDDFSKILSDVDYVVHIAAATSQNLLRYEDYSKVNVDATVQLFHAASVSKVKRFVFISSVNTLGYGTADSPGTECKPPQEPFTSSLYANSKIEAEDYLLTQKHGPEVIVINPTFILGEYIAKAGSGRIIHMGWKKKVILYPPGGKNFVHSKDVAQGIINSFSAGINGEKYILANENLSYEEFFSKLNEIAGQNPIMLKIPWWILMFTGYIGEFLRKCGIKTSISLVNMKILCTRNYYSNKKSVKELGVRYRSTDWIISDSLNYISANSKRN